jgi:hypothetical protein
MTALLSRHTRYCKVGAALALAPQETLAMHRHAFWIILGIAVCCPAGCGPKFKLVEVSGTVTYNGKPPNGEGLNIVFLGPNGKSADGQIAPNGEYKVSGVVAGPNKVAIWYHNPESAKTREPGVKAPASVSPLRNLPLKYGDVKTSELTVDVDTGTVFNPKMTGPDLK